MALTKIGNVLGPKGDKGDKGDTPKINIGEVYSGPDVNVEAITDENGDVTLNFILQQGEKGDTGNGVSSIVGTKVDGGTDVTFNMTDSETTKTFKMLDGLNGDGILDLGKIDGGFPVINSKGLKFIFYYIYKNVSEYNKYFTFKFLTVGNVWQTYIGYIERNNNYTLYPGTGKTSIILLKFSDDGNYKYACDITNYTTDTEIDDFSFEEDIISTGMIDLGVVNISPTLEENNILNNITNYSVSYTFICAGIRYIMFCSAPVSTLKIQQLFYIGTDGTLTTLTRKYNNGVWSVGDLNTHATQKYVGVINLGIVNDFLPGESELDTIKTPGLYSFNMSDKPYLMFVNKEGFINQFIFSSEGKNGYKGTRRYYNLQTNEWAWDEGNYNLATEDFVEEKINNLGLVNLGNLSETPTSEDNATLNSLTQSGVYKFTYNGYAYLMLMDYKKEKQWAQQIFSVSYNNVLGVESATKKVITRYTFTTGGVTSIFVSNNELTTKEYVDNLQKYNHRITFKFESDALIAEAFFTIVNNSNEPITSSTICEFLKSPEKRQASGYAKYSSASTIYSVYAVGYAEESDYDNIALYFTDSTPEDGESISPNSEYVTISDYIE